MKQLINKIRGILSPPAFLDTPTEEGFLIWPETASAPQEKVRLSGSDRLVTEVHRPSVIYYPAKGNPTGTAMIIAPGGSHRELWVDHEGDAPARWLAERGIAAFVLKYRLGAATGSPYSVETHALADILRAIRYVRSRGAEWGIDTNRIGVMGFSAGGELAALAAMRYEKPPLTINDTVDRLSSRPDFQVLVYPSDPHRYIVTSQSPPAFLCAGYQDCADITVECAKLFVRFKEKGIPAELHLYANTGHGFGFRQENKGGIGQWPQRLYDWLGDSRLLG